MGISHKGGNVQGGSWFDRGHRWPRLRERTTSGQDFDLDASAIATGIDGKVLSDNHFAFFNNQTNLDGSAERILTGGGDGVGVGEQIKVNLAGRAVGVDKVVYPVSIYEADRRGQAFGQVRNAFIRVVNQADGRELTRYDVS
jgi:tellurium resistance protein TerD